MKLTLGYSATATLLGLSLALSTGKADAATFEQKDLDPSQVIAVAVPLAQSDRYNLLILEQLSSARPCWQAQPGGTVEPLLLQFDFTNICGRSTDSNGYSIRIGGEDKGIEYRLSIVKRGDRLVLMGVPNRGGANSALEIAQTQGLAPGFLQFVLNPEWRLAKRVYQGKALGHIYLATDTFPASGIASNVPSNVPSNLPRNVSGNVLLGSGGASAPYSANLSGSRDPFSQKIVGSQSVGNRSVGNRNSSRSANRTRTASPAPLFRGNDLPPVRSLSRASAYSGRVSPITAPIQIPVPDPPFAPRIAARPATPGTYRPLSVPNLPGDNVPGGNRLPALPGGALAVPSGNIPMGRVGNEADLITASTPGVNLNAMAPGAGFSPAAPFQVALVNFRYRVFVNPANPAQQRTVKTLVPDSFRSSYQGRPVLQVGAFQDRAKADEVINLLNQNGITSILSSDQ